MRPFLYERVPDARRAVEAVADRAQPGVAPTEAAAQFIAGGTMMLDLMKLDSMRPAVLVDINGLAAAHGRLEAGPEGLSLGALVRMNEAAEHPAILRDYPVIAETLQLAASPQLRNMASLGGNVLQRTRCQYFRDHSWSACNKRVPGSGCAALDGVNRKHAVLGVSDRCIAAYSGDFAQALVVLDAKVHTLGPQGPRIIPVEQLHTDSSRPNIETILEPGELITEFRIPAGAWTRRSTYVKVRDRQSYEYGLATAAVALDIRDGTVGTARVALGSVSYRPWRAREAEAELAGKRLDESSAEAAAKAAFAGVRPTHRQNDYKIELGRRTLVRALLQAGRMEI
jgi:xanthine dehydrogenase YagS FAD-binding subunit